MNIRDRIVELRKVPANTVRPSPRNWRTHPKEQADALRGLLADVGFAGAILARQLPDGSLEAIDGHLRLETMGAEEVPVLVTDLTETEAVTVLATFDPLGAMAGTDKDKLDALLREVTTQNDAVIGMIEELATNSGLDWADGLTEPGEGGDEFDATPETTGPTRTNAGELWVIGGKHRLLVGDCTKAENVERLMDGAKWKCSITDPPYGVDYQGGRNPESNKAREKLANDGDARIYSRYLPAADMHRDKKSVMYIWFAGSKGGAVFSSVEAAGWDVRALIVWNKLDAHYGNFMAQYMNKHEPCLYCVKDGTDWYGPTNEVTVWDIKQPAKNEFHPTQKPIECMSRAMENSTAKGELVYDPFLGSGTTMIAAHRLGRTCYGCEIEPRYADVILKRAEAEGMTCERLEG